MIRLLLGLLLSLVAQIMVDAAKGNLAEEIDYGEEIISCIVGEEESTGSAVILVEKSRP